MSERNLYLVAGPPENRPGCAELVCRAVGRGHAPPGTVLPVENADLAGCIAEHASDAEKGRVWLVPAPHSPHFFARWLLDTIPGEWRPALDTALPDVAFARRLGDGVLASVAEWRCPSRCIEPAICPATRQPKSWRIEESLEEWAREQTGAQALLLSRCGHRGGGVMAQSIGEWIEARGRILAELEPSGEGERRYVAATASACHALATILCGSRKNPAGTEALATGRA